MKIPAWTTLGSLCMLTMPGFAAAEAVVQECVAGARTESALELSSPDLRVVVIAEHAMGADHCNADGNLIEAKCPDVAGCVPTPTYPFCSPDSGRFQTGEIRARFVDCNGNCTQGTCPVGCPDFDDVLTYLEIGANVTRFRNERDGRVLDCVLSRTGSEFDCRSEPRVGDQDTIVARGIFGGANSCAGRDFGNISLSRGCAYACSTANTEDRWVAKDDRVPSTPEVCRAGDPALDVRDTEVRHDVWAENGGFTDECDAEGNLIEYRCAAEYSCDADGLCLNRETGQAIPTQFDCGGECSRGTCRSRCLQYHDILEIASIDGDHAIFENQTYAMRFGTRYECQLTFDSTNDGFDCRTDPTVGSHVIVSALGGGYLNADFCTGAVTGSFMPRNYLCSWNCVIVLPD